MIRIALAQLNQVVGGLDGNLRRIRAAIDEARRADAQVLALPELAITGYPPEDLLHRRSFVDAARAKLDELAKDTDDLLTVVGFVDRDGDHLFNAAAICQHGGIIATYRKQLLPNYGVFDEDRYFEPGDEHILFETPDGVIGVCVCEDAWGPSGPLITQGDAGAQVVININASPYHKRKLTERAQMLCDRARKARTSIAYVNMVGGQDELVFDGGSLIVGPDGTLLARAEQFAEGVFTYDVPLGEARRRESPRVRRVQTSLRPASSREPELAIADELDEHEEIYRTLTLSLADYCRKNHFTKAVIGLSGGIDSSLAAAIAADALGPENVLGVTMPSEFSSSGSVDDSKLLAENLGMEMLQIPIARPYRTYVDALEDVFGETEMGVAEENLQARIRGNLLMAISNRYGHLVIATGNKSEMACGYATLYGDMAGGFAILKDVFKTEVYNLARWRNRASPAIPEAVLTKAPSAELRPGQRDADSLPPYEVLDPILEAYIEDDASIEDIVAAGNDEQMVRTVIKLVDRAEYKRRQAPPGPKVTVKAFGRDRRLPITNLWKEGLSEFPTVGRVTGAR